MNRRGFLLALLAPFASRLLPKAKPSIVEAIEFRMTGSQRLMTEALARDMYQNGMVMKARQLGMTTVSCADMEAAYRSANAGSNYAAL